MIQWKCTLKDQWDFFLLGGGRGLKERYNVSNTSDPLKVKSWKIQVIISSKTTFQEHMEADKMNPNCIIASIDFLRNMKMDI